MEFRKIIPINLLQGNKRDANIKNKLWTQWRREKVERIERVALKHIITIYNIR